MQKKTNYCTDKYQTAKLAKLNCFATKQLPNFSLITCNFVQCNLSFCVQYLVHTLKKMTNNVLNVQLKKTYLRLCNLF